MSDEDVKRAIANVLSPLGVRRDAVITTKEIASELGYGSDHKAQIKVHKRVSLQEDRKFSASEYLIIAKETASRGDLSLLELALPVGFEIRSVGEIETNGQVDDDIAEENEHLGNMRSLLRGKKHKEALKEIDLAEKELADLRAEVRSRMKKK